MKKLENKLWVSMPQDLNNERPRQECQNDVTHPTLQEGFSSSRGPMQVGDEASSGSRFHRFGSGTCNDVYTTLPMWMCSVVCDVWYRLWLKFNTVPLHKSLISHEVNDLTFIFLTFGDRAIFKDFQRKKRSVVEHF